MNLLDFQQFDDPQTMGLLALASGLMAPGRNPGVAGLGESLSQGLMSGAQGYTAAREAQVKRALQQAQLAQQAQEMALRLSADRRESELFPVKLDYTRAQAEKDRADVEKMKADLARQEAMMRYRASVFSPTTPTDAASLPGGPTQANSERIGSMPMTRDMMPKLQAGVALGAFKPEEVKALMEMPNYGREKVAGVRSIQTPGGPQEVPYGEFGATMPALGPKAPDVPWYVKYANGTPSIDPAFKDLELTKASESAPKISVPVSVNTEKQLTGTLAEVVGKNVAASREAALKSAQSLDTIGRITSALDSGKVIAGPMTDARVVMRQVGQVAGLGGKTNDETLSRTREVIQGLSKLSLDGAAAMQGQGQITEYERKLIADAASGQLKDLTIPEMRALMSVFEKVNRAAIDANSANLKRLESVPGAAPVLPFFSVPQPQMSAPKAGPQPGRVIDFSQLPR